MSKSSLKIDSQEFSTNAALTAALRMDSAKQSADDLIRGGVLLKGSHRARRLIRLGKEKALLALSQARDMKSRIRAQIALTDASKDEDAAARRTRRWTEEMKTHWESSRDAEEKLTRLLQLIERGAESTLVSDPPSRHATASDAGVSELSLQAASSRAAHRDIANLTEANRRARASHSFQSRKSRLQKVLCALSKLKILGKIFRYVGAALGTLVSIAASLLAPAATPLLSLAKSFIMPLFQSGWQISELLLGRTAQSQLKMHPQRDRQEGQTFSIEKTSENKILKDNAKIRRSEAILRDLLDETFETQRV